jgi:hypothetical protein
VNTEVYPVCCAKTEPVLQYIKTVLGTNESCARIVPGMKANNSMYEVLGGYKVLGTRYWVQGTGCKVLGTKALGTRCWVLGTR